MCGPLRACYLAVHGWEDMALMTLLLRMLPRLLLLSALQLAAALLIAVVSSHALASCLCLILPAC